MKQNNTDLRDSEHTPSIDQDLSWLSILDCYLKHSWAHYFHNNGQGDLFLSSADWMTRNLNRKIAGTFSISDLNNIAQILK